MKSRLPRIALLGCVIILGVMILSGCSGTTAPANLSQVNPVATVPYLPPTVVPDTPVATATATATATTPRKTHPTNTPVPAGPPPPIPTAGSLPAGPMPAGTVPNIGGQLILVSLSQQWLFAFQDHRLVFRTAVTTGMPQLPTPTGTFHIMWHEHNVTFYSPWPPSSPYYYSPEHVNYAMYFRNNGYYIHDAPWRHAFGPGTNYPHIDPDGTHETGSHGCVNVPTGPMSWLYSWAHDGATVVIYGHAATGPAPTPTPTKTPAAPAPTPTDTPAPAPTATDTPTPTA
jgi:lipoprotein-anchoring transpeptidase ErfK/SrfK